MPTALIVDQDNDNLQSLAEVFRKHGFDTETAHDLSRARDLLLRKMPDVALIDEQVDGQASLDVLEEIEVGEVVDVYLMSSKRSIGGASRAMRAGVSEYLDKPVDVERLDRSLRALANDLKGSSDTEDGANSVRERILGASRPMERLHRLVRKVAPSDASVLITGESGTGKDLVAQAVHELSGRSRFELVAVNCSAIPRDLIESQLFGHEKGSFTGAADDHRGFFDQAAGGTLFLDEITEMSPDLQAKLLRALESGVIRPVGSETDKVVDCRIIAATNADPEEAVKTGHLRDDLFYRLAQFPIRVPPLRERGEDVRLLAEHFLEQQNSERGVRKSLSDGALEAILLHDWPGNVRELKNALVHGHLLAGNTIEAADLPDGMPTSVPSGNAPGRSAMGRTLAEVERRHILATLAWCDGNKKRAAEVLGIAQKTLYNRLKKYGVT